MTENNQPKQQITAADLMAGMKAGQKTTAADILKSTMEKDQNLHMKANINNPFGYALIHGNADYIQKRGFKNAAELDRSFANYTEVFGVSKKGERVKQVLKAVTAVLTMEHEENKAKSKLMGGQSQ